MHHINRILTAASVGALILLSACNSQPETVTNGGPAPDPALNTADAAEPVALPPAIEASRTYRCKDTSLVYVDFFGDKLTANFRTDKAGLPTKLTAPAVGEAFVADGYSVAANAPVTEIASPGKPAQTCKA